MQSAAPFTQALSLYREGQWKAAHDLCVGIVQQQPANADALHLLGLVQARQGDWPAALDWLDRALRAQPERTAAILDRANVLLQAGRPREALLAYEHAIALQADLVPAWFGRGNAQRQLGERAAALASFERLLVLQPAHVEAWNSRGITLRELDRAGEALQCYERALALQPGHVHALCNRGLALLALNRITEALQCQDEAIRLHPGHADAHNIRGNALMLLERAAGALSAYDRALALRPAHAEAHSNRGKALRILRRPAEAAAAFAKALQCQPGFAFGKGDLLYARLGACQWSELDELVQDIDADVRAGRAAVNPFEYQAVCADEALLQAAATISAARHPAFPARPRAKRPLPAHIRVGYLCGEFREQATAHLMCGVWEAHDKSRVEIHAIDSSTGDGSPMRRRIEAAFASMVDIAHLSDAEAASRIAGLDLDVLVNLNGFFGSARPGVFARRPARVQVNYLGFPGTLGSPAIDYLLGDAQVLPQPSWPHYNEKIVWLPHCYQANDAKKAIAPQVPARAALGLPEQGFVYCCFNNSYKILPATFASWMTILRAVPGSVLWLIDDNPDATRNLRAEARARGVDETRLVFTPRVPIAEHLARHAAADLFLDSLPYNAHTTASDALWAGLPVLTRTGTSFPGRVAASLLRAIGLPELVTGAAGEFEKLAIALAHDPDRLAGLRRRLQDNRLRTPLFDTARFTRHLEAALIAMVERDAAGLAPAHLRIGAEPDEVQVQWMEDR